MEKQLRSAWNQVVEQFAADHRPLVRTVPSIEPADLHAAWAGCLSSIRAAFAAHCGPATVEERFRVPEESATFMQIVGGGWRWPHGLEWTLFDAETVAAVTADDFEQLVVGANEDEPVLDSGFWLGIGWYSDKHEYLLCCDRSHRYYGAVVDGHDSHPWLNGVEFGGCYRAADSFLAWLEMRAQRR